MKKIIIVMAMLAFLGVISAEEKIINLGVHPFYKSKNLKAEDLKKIAIDRVGDVKIGFEEAGAGELVYAFIEQIQKAEIQTIDVQPGDRLAWMMFKEGRKVKVVKDAVWAGKKSMTAYKFDIFREGTLYTFIVPLVCGNISLLGSSAVPPPACSLNVMPEEVEKGKAFKVDVCESKNAIKNTVTISDEAGNVVKTLELTAANCSAEVVLDNPGTYTVENVSEGQYGMKSTKPCKVRVKVVVPPPPPPIVAGDQGGAGKSAGKLGFLADVGIAQMVDPTTFLFLRAGIQYRFTDKTRLNLLAGPWFNLNDNFYGTPISVDAILSFHPSKFWLGGGLGAWLVKDDNKADLIGELGYELFHSEKAHGSLFFEARFGLSDFDNMGDMWRYGLGFRFGLTPKK